MKVHINDVANQLNISYTRIRNWKNEGLVPFIMDNKKIYFDEEGIERIKEVKRIYDEHEEKNAKTGSQVKLTYHEIREMLDIEAPVPVEEKEPTGRVNISSQVSYQERHSEEAQEHQILRLLLEEREASKLQSKSLSVALEKVDLIEKGQNQVVLSSTELTELGKKTIQQLMKQEQEISNQFQLLLNSDERRNRLQDEQTEVIRSVLVQNETINEGAEKIILSQEQLSSAVQMMLTRLAEKEEQEKRENQLLLETNELKQQLQAEREARLVAENEANSAKLQLAAANTLAEEKVHSIEAQKQLVEKTAAEKQKNPGRTNKETSRAGNFFAK
ncbi:MerR family transcriptional regulator [Aneurinibacillus tyrosinisolvens]|uniref:MerR family transcriptional regulator n=1 Tax=Aneurinibacillus tyrosinisolvens TaxID=1443435 RepID=UPI00063FCBDA|nr:MerR family transcriptional regulator [Aneurinibacillus tyrosinisolvens]